MSDLALCLAGALALPGGEREHRPIWSRAAFSLPDSITVRVGKMTCHHRNIGCSGWRKLYALSMVVGRAVRAARGCGNPCLAVGAGRDGARIL